MFNHRRCGKVVWPRYCVVFGIGLALSCFCPTCFIMFVVAAIMVILGIALLSRC